MKKLGPPVIVLLLTFIMPHQSNAAPEEHPANWRGQPITEFDSNENEAFEWEIVNDGVMGGLSQGTMEFTESGILRFYGDLSLDNNGGFTTMRSGDVSLDLSNDLGLLLKVKGDGRTYEARLATDARYRGMEVSFMGKFETKAGQWHQVKIPFSEFEASFRGMKLKDEVLDPSKITRIGLLLGDKKAGPFELEVDWIRTYGKGQGSGPLAPDLTKADDGPSNLIDTAVADGRFTLLKKALDTAKLTTFFQWDNPLTVFAPTDEAFKSLPEGVLEDLLKPENKDKLVAILSYHVIVGNNRLTDALEAGKVKTIEGNPLAVSFSEGRVRINNAALIDADIEASDGIIHVIDTVLLPPEKKDPTLLSVAEEAGSFTTLLAAINAADLTEVLEGKGPFTVFAPTDDAFRALPKGTVETLLQEENREKLVDVLTYHVVSGKVSAGDALNARKADSVEGSALKFQIDQGAFKVNESTIQSVDIDGGNGVIHVIDTVLLPPSIAEKMKSKSDGPSNKISSASQSIIDAIEKGVPLYNNGNAAACAEVYENCLISLSENPQFDGEIQTKLEDVIAKGRDHSVMQRAWIYRHALDAMMAEISRRMN